MAQGEEPSGETLVRVTWGLTAPLVLPDASPGITWKGRRQLFLCQVLVAVQFEKRNRFFRPED